MKKQPKTYTTKSFCISNAIISKIQQDATDQRRSFSEVVRHILETHYRVEGEKRG